LICADEGGIIANGVSRWKPHFFRWAGYEFLDEIHQREDLLNAEKKLLISS
jgi:hypothetical protein